MFEYRTQGNDNSPQELLRYIYSNHLQSSSLELDENGEIISYEEYHPFGTTAYQATNASINAVAKRYKYTGKERDEESGFYYHGARYYIPWLCRWTQCDPIGIKDGLNVYAYCSNNPVMLHDPSGTSGEGERIEYSTNPNGKIEGKIDTVVITPNKTELTTDNVNVNQGKELDPSMFSNAGGFGSMALQDEYTSSAGTIAMNYQKNLIVEQAIYIREQQKITQCIQDNQTVLYADGSGGTVGDIRKAQIAYNQQVGSNVTGGVFGSAAFLAGNYFGGYEKGARWSFGGAIFDQGAATMAVQRPNFSTQTSTNVNLRTQSTYNQTNSNGLRNNIRINSISIGGDVKSNNYLGEGTMFTHFTNQDAIIGITGVNVSTLNKMTVGSSILVNKLTFGKGLNSFKSNSANDIFITDLNINSKSLNLVGVFGDKQNFGISISQESALYNGIRFKQSDRNIFTMPGNSSLQGNFMIFKLK